MTREAGSPERVFAVLGVVFGLAFAIVSPPHDPPDEVRHFARAYLISEGKLAPPGAKAPYRSAIPRSLIDLHPPHGSRRFVHDAGELVGRLGDPVRPKRRIDIPLLTLYSPVAYAPQSVAVGFARALGASPAAMLYAGRAANVLTYVALVVLAIRLTPLRKWALVMIAGSPMALYLAGSLSGDSITIALSVLLFACVLRCSYGEQPGVSTGRIAALVTLCALLGLCKPGYWPVAALVLFISPTRFRDARTRWLFVTLCAAAMLLPSGAWTAWVQLSEPFALSPNTDPVAQLTHVLTHPLHFAGVLLLTIALQLIPYIVGFTGLLGQLDIPLPIVLYFLYPAALVYVIRTSPPDPTAITRRVYQGAAALFLVCALGMLSIGYLGWNEVASPLIVGIQGRYFIPMAPALALAIPAGWTSVPAARPLWITLFCGGCLTTAVAVLARHYYTGV